MRIRGENEYCIGITWDEPNQYCAPVYEWNTIKVPYQPCRLSPFKPSSTITPRQSSAYPACFNSDRIKNNSLANKANSLADIYTAAKKVQKQNRRSSIGTNTIAQRNVVFQNRVFDLTMVN
jgi:hypothetical protein